MSRLYADTATATELLHHFRVEETRPFAVPAETVEGLPGLVVLNVAGRRAIRSMTWGFPRSTREMRSRGEPPGRLGLVADLTNAMWDTMVVDPRYRCLIPLTHFANPAGEAGAKTRAWFSVEGEPIVAWAGFCRNTPEFGPVFAGMTMAANERVMPHNDRMPVLLGVDEYDRWLDGPIQEVIGFQFRAPLAAARTVVEHTGDLWRSGSPPPSGRPQLALI